MCLIVDANLAAMVFVAPTPADFIPIIEWLTSDDKNGKLVVGGKLAEELDKVGLARRFVRALQQAGRARIIPNQVVNAETDRIAGQCKSNDAHVISLARISGARVLCSADKPLHQDFRNLELINTPRGRIYQTQAHAQLLRNYGHTTACRKLLNA